MLKYFQIIINSTVKYERVRGMRKVSVPLVRFTEPLRDEILLRLEELGAQRVFLCTDRGIFGDENRKERLDELTESVSFFSSRGYEVGIWLSSLGHGSGLTGLREGEYASRYTNITGITGETAQDSFCPLDESFTRTYCGWVSSLAQTGASLIMFDDDYRLAYRPGGFGCLCKNHIRLFREALGEDIKPEDLLGKAFCGGSNKYRDIFLKITGDTLYAFAKRLRSTVDEVAPGVRLGVCTCLSTWDSDGIDCFELTKIFAGDTEPFLRLIGAPYWARTPGFGGFANKPAYIIELERMQAYWCRDRLSDIMSEGDVYPRPRYCTPAAYLEGFDTALIANGAPGGILKYAVDYSSSPSYEKGYCSRAAANKPLYPGIEEMFSGKMDAGIFPACEIHKIRDTVYPDRVLNISAYGENSFIQPEQAFLCDNSIPVKYEKGGICACFGQNAAYLDTADFGGFIIDLPAALILASRGTDTGIISSEPLTDAVTEVFPDETERVALTNSEGLLRAVLSPDAQILSYYEAHGNPPGSYYYENAGSQKFYVICADMENARSNCALRRNYCRQRQLIKVSERLSGQKLPAVCPGNPDLYLLCKSSGGSLSVGLWNFFEDSIPNACIELDSCYSQAEFLNCTGRLEGDKVYINGDIPAFSYIFFEVNK